MTEPTARFHIIRGVGKYDAIGYAIPKDEPGPLHANPRQRWAILFIEDTCIGPATSAAHTTRTELPPEQIGPAISDLMRDAARYRWIIGNGVGRLDDLYDACNWEPVHGQIDGLIDAEITREAEKEGTP